MGHAVLKESVMSYLGTYQPWSDTWVYTFVECGQELQVSAPFTPLDGLDWRLGLVNSD